MGDEPMVQVEVVVNFDGLRRGWMGEVELTDRIQSLIGRGYLRLLGHVPEAVASPVAVEVLPVASVEPEPPTQPEMPTAAPRRSAGKRKATTIPPGGDGGDRTGPAGV